jgi:hypothetical protein
MSAAIEAMFRKCATDPTKFYRANSSSALVAAFDNVAADTPSCGDQVTGAAGPAGAFKPSGG